jgi:thymidylate synthase (FAD)
MMKVELLSYTQDPQKVIYSAARQCYSKFGAAEIFNESKKVESKKLKDFIEHLMARGHKSPLEHVNFTFAIEGVSRVLTHQLVRHRIASYSQQSQRYVSMENFGFITPPLIAKNKAAKQKFEEAIKMILAKSEELKKILESDEKLNKEKINEDVRFLLPGACDTKIVVTMNCRELLHFFAERTCMRAQWEIRELAGKMYGICKKTLPEVFHFGGPKCKIHKYCPEKNETCPLNPKK